MSEIETFDSKVKQKGFNNEKRLKHQSLIPVYATLYSSIMTIKWYFFHFLTFQRTESSSQVIFLSLEWHKNLGRICYLII